MNMNLPESASGSRSEAPKVSIVTVVRNGAGTIVRAMDSVLGQSYPNIEYIVIDGASTDGTLDLIRRYQDRLAFWSSEPDSGISDAFNKGIRRATGEWVGILNADDWYEPDAVSKVMTNAVGAAVVHGAMRYWDQMSPVEMVYPDQSKMLKEMCLGHPTCFVRRELYGKYGLFDESYKYAMDYEFLIRLFLNGERFVQLDDIIANMQCGGVSDDGWMSACAEVRDAKIKNNMNMLAAWAWYEWQLVRRHVRWLLEKLGAKIIVDLYRARVSASKKHRI